MSLEVVQAQLTAALDRLNARVAARVSALEQDNEKLRKLHDELAVDLARAEEELAHRPDPQTIAAPEESASSKEFAALSAAYETLKARCAALEARNAALGSAARSALDRVDALLKEFGSQE